MKVIPIILLLTIVVFSRGNCQIGGNGTYKFLDLTNSATMAALGGTQIAFADNDLNLAYINPSLLSDSMSNQLSVNYVSYIAGIGVGYAAFAPRWKGPITFAAGIHYVNYGNFEGASETGQLTGSFRAAEYALNFSFSGRITPQLFWGINVKPIFSSFESYQSFGLAADLGVSSLSTDRNSVYSLVIRDIGGQLTTYYKDGVREPLLVNIQLGMSKRLNNAPARFFATFEHLNNWDLSYESYTGEKVTLPRENFTSTLMRHLLVGGEIYPEQHVTLRFGYNYRRQKELAAESRPGLVGFSAGLGLKFSKFNLNYGIASFHLSATVHYFSFSTNLYRFIR